jgi:hypothetical protein
MTTTDAQQRQVPTPLPLTAEDPKTLLERVQALFPKFVKGKTAEVDPHLVEVRDYAKYAIEQWELQLAIANFELQRQMGDAEIAVVNGMPKFKRLQYPVKGYWVDSGSRDFIKGTKR